MDKKIIQEKHYEKENNKFLTFQKKESVFNLASFKNCCSLLKI